MSYIGNAPISAAFLTDTFSGNGSTVAFTMTVAPANTSSIIVAITGVLQDPSTYSVSGTTLTFSAAPPSGTSNISVRYLGIPASGVTTTAYRTVTNTTATAGQTSFTIPSYTVGYVDVYRNGVYLPTSDYTATTGTTVVLNNAATVGDTITTISFYVSSVLNAIPATAGSVSDSYIVSMAGSKLTGTQTVPSGTLPAGSVLQVQSTFTTTNAVNTTTSYADVTNLTVNITPKFATSKILITWYVNAVCSTTNNSTITQGYLQLADGSNNQIIQIFNQGIAGGASNNLWNVVSGTYLHSPATTSALTYKIRFYNPSGAGMQTNNYQTTSGNGSSITVQEIAA